MTPRGRKDFSAHSSLDALTAGLAQRYEPTEPAPAASSSADKGRRAKPGTKGTGMVTRSWYLPEDIANALAAAADELYYDLRGKVPKHAVLAALIAAGIDQTATVREKLSQVSQT